MFFKLIYLNKISKFQTNFNDWGILYEIALMWLSLDLIDDYSTSINVGSGNGLVLSSNKPLPAPLQVCANVDQNFYSNAHMATIALNVLVD